MGVLVTAVPVTLLAACLLPGGSAEEPAWNYSKNGDDWPELFYTCGHMQSPQQSPIDIQLSKVNYLKARDMVECTGRDSRHLEPCFIESLRYEPLGDIYVWNTGNKIQVSPLTAEGFGITRGMPGEQRRVEYGGVMMFRRINFKSPSEHKVDGHQYAMEMQLEHWNAANESSVISIFFDDTEDEDNEFLNKIGSPSLPAKGDWYNRTNLTDEDSNIRNFFNETLSGDFYRYEGSLTRPPCTEAIHWFIMAKPAKISTRQVNEFREMAGVNNRNIQSNDLVIWKNLYSLVDNNEAPACPIWKNCPGPDCEQPVYGCETTCRLMDEALDPASTSNPDLDLWRPLGHFTCPESCPILAPCTQKRDLRCILGSDTVKFVLNWEGKAHDIDVLNSDEITPSDCKFYISTSQPDPATHECSSCNITGCSICFSPEMCAKCIDGYEDCSLQCPSHNKEVCEEMGLVKGQCCDTWSWMWEPIIPLIWSDASVSEDIGNGNSHFNLLTFKIIGIVLSVILFVALVILCKCRRDPEGYKIASMKARLTLPRDFLKSGQTFPICKFWEWHQEDRAGEGIFLFFNFYLFVLLSVCCIGGVHFIMHHRNPQLAQLTGIGFHGGDFGENQESENGKTGFLRCPVSNAKALFLEDEDFYRENYTGPLLHIAFLTYAVGLGLSFIFSILMEAWRIRFKAFHSEKMIANCCLQVEGLPRSITKAEQVEAWFGWVCSQCGGSNDDVVGASLGYLVAREDFNTLETRCEQITDEWRDPRFDLGPSDSACLDAKKIDERRKLNSEVTSILNGADGSGWAYVVFSSSSMATKVYKYISNANKDMHQKENFLVKQFTGRGSIRQKKNPMADIMKPLLAEAGLKQDGDELDLDKGLCFTVHTHRGDMKTVPQVERVKAPPENIRWGNLCMQRDEVWVKITQIPARVILSMLLLLCFFMPTGLIFARYARIKSGDTHPLVWKLISQILAAVYASSYNAAMITAVNCAESFGAVIRDGEDLVALTLVLISTTVLTFVNVAFTMQTMVPAYMEHMSIQGLKPTKMDATASNLYTLIFPSLIAMRYIVEPMMKYFTPQILNRFILPKLVKPDPDKYPRMLQWPEISPVWTYGDLILNTSLCCTIFFFITESAAKLWLYFALTLLARYVWLSVAWCKASTQRRVGTAKLFRFVLGLWSIPTGMLAASVGYWWMLHSGGLAKFPPRGLPNGPVEWDPEDQALPFTRANTCFWVHIVIYFALVMGLGTVIGSKLGDGFVWCCGQSGRGSRKQHYTYEELKANCPADFFNTNAPVVLASRRVFGHDGDVERLLPDNALYNEMLAMMPKCVRLKAEPLHPYESGREYQQGPPFDKPYLAEMERLGKKHK